MIHSENKRTAVFSFALILGFFLPHNNIVGLIISGLLPLLLFVLLVDKKSFKLNKFTTVFILVIYLSFILNVFIGDNIEAKSLLRILNLTLLFMLFPFCENVRIPNNTLYIILGVILLSQLAFSFGILSIVNLIDRFYPYEGDVSVWQTEFFIEGAGDIDVILNKRYGGIYRNSNQLSRYVSILFVVFLIENRRKTIVKLLPFIGIVVISVLLTGSRTGLIVTAVLLFGKYFILEYNKSKLSIIASISFLAFILFLVYIYISSFDLRGFNIAAGLDDSIGTKLDWFLKFFYQLDSFSRILLGHFSSDNVQLYGISLLDSEWGELFYNFGFLGLVSLTIFYISIYKTKSKILRFYLLILLWCISSTVVFSYRMSFIFMLLLSKYYADYKQKKYTKNEYTQL